MGGLSRYLPFTTGADVDRRALAGGRPAVLGLLLEGSDPRRRARARRLGRLHRVGARPGRRVRDGALHVPADAARVLRAAERVRPRHARGARRATARGRSRCSGRSASWPSARSSPASSRSRGPRTACATSSSPRSRPASRRRACRSSAPRRSRSRSRSSGCSPPTCCGGAAAARRPRRIAAATAPIERVLQEKFGFDRLYDWAFYRPASAIARGGERLWEEPVIGGSMDGVGSAGGWTSRLLSTAQSGLVRVYALAIAIGIAALAAWLITGAA